MQTKRRAGDVAFLKQRVKGEQQVEIDAAKIIHAANDRGAPIRFPLMDWMVEHSPHRTGSSVFKETGMLSRAALLAMIPSAFALAAGAVLPFQAASNAAIGRALGHPLGAR